MTVSLADSFDVLRKLMLHAASGMDKTEDRPGSLVLKTRWLDPKKKEPGWFGAVQLKKNYVSYHLMPLYALPTLANDISPELRKRMQGKSCFNFKRVEPTLQQELEELTGRCAAAYSAPVEPKPHS